MGEVDITTRTRTAAAVATATGPGTAIGEEGTGEVSEVVEEEGSAAETETGTEAGMEDTRKEEIKEKYTKNAFDVLRTKIFSREKGVNRHVLERDQKLFQLSSRYLFVVSTIS